MIRVDASRAVDGLTAAVIVAVALGASPIVLRHGRSDARAAERSVIARPAAVPVDLGPLRRFAPFGRRAATPGAPGDPSLGLDLRGIMLTRPAAASIALIAAAGGPAKGYAVGAMLPGGAVVDAIEYDLVVLRSNGQVVTLALPAKPGGAAAPAGTARAPTPAITTADPIEAHHAREQDPLTLLGSLGATPGAGGYRVGASLSDDLQRAGLKPGDVVEKVGGQPVGDPARDRTLFDDAVVAGRMQVEVVRDGRRVALSLPLH